MIRVVIADDQALIRAGFRALLERDPEIVVVGEAADGDQAVQVVRRHTPDIVLMDIRMPMRDGIAATRAIVADPRLTRTRVVIVTTYDLDENVFGALAAGAAGFILKDVEPDDLRRAVHIVAAGDALLAPGVTRRLIARFVADHTVGRAPAAAPAGAPDADSARMLTRLTDREREIVAYVAEGLSNDEIAARLFISPTTVKTHASHAMLKLGARDRAQLVVFAYRSGLAG